MPPAVTFQVHTPRDARDFEGKNEKAHCGEREVLTTAESGEPEGWRMDQFGEMTCGAVGHVGRSGKYLHRRSTTRGPSTTHFARGKGAEALRIQRNGPAPRPAPAPKLASHLPVRRAGCWSFRTSVLIRPCVVVPPDVGPGGTSNSAPIRYPRIPMVQWVTTVTSQTPGMSGLYSRT